MIALAHLRRLFAGPSRPVRMTDDADSERWVGLLAERLPAGRTEWLARFLREQCQSPIEREFAAGFLTLRSRRFTGQARVLFPRPLVSIEAACRAYRRQDGGRDGLWHLVPQVTFNGRKRLDFVATHISPDGRFAMVAVECDGSLWHGATMWQAFRDERRDHWLRRRQVETLRFSGSEIRRNPFRCAGVVKDALTTMLRARR